MVAACRPKDGKDARILQTGRLIKDACKGIRVVRGECLKPEEAKILNKQCFNAIADLLGASEEQAATIFSALSTIHTECMDETSQGQAAFHNEDPPSEETPSEDSPPDGNASDDNASDDSSASDNSVSDDNASDDSASLSNATVAAQAVTPSSDSPERIKMAGISGALALFACFMVNM